MLAGHTRLRRAWLSVLSDGSEHHITRVCWDFGTADMFYSGIFQSLVDGETTRLPILAEYRHVGAPITQGIT